MSLESPQRATDVSSQNTLNLDLNLRPVVELANTTGLIAIVLPFVICCNEDYELHWLLIISGIVLFRITMMIMILPLVDKDTVVVVVIAGAAVMPIVWVMMMRT